MRRASRALAAAILGAAVWTCASAAENLLRNSDFGGEFREGRPSGWYVPKTQQELSIDRAERPAGCSHSLRVAIKAEERHYGQIVQEIRNLKPRTAYVLSGKLKSSSSGIALLQVKLYRDGKELKRITSESSKREWRTIAQEFNTADSDKVEVLCRYVQAADTVGDTVWFAGLRLVDKTSFVAEPGPPLQRKPGAVPTFECIGLSVPAGGPITAGSGCTVRYRKRSGRNWRKGMDLVPYPPEQEYRGSLLNLDAGTDYEIECGPSLAGVKRAGIIRLSARTWKEGVPVGQVRRLRAGVSTEPVVISARGRPGAWVLYAPPKGGTSTIEAGKKAPAAVLFKKAAYVVFENVTVRGGARDGVNVADSHHVRIRRCDIADWGDAGVKKLGMDKGLYVDSSGRRINYHAGVHVSRDSSQIVVEDNFVHRPRGTANSWVFGHPMGPQGILLDRTGGNNVVRNNDVIGSENHWWNDAIESLENSGVNGGPYRDTDISGNVLAFSNDDGTELDGGQINVRFHNNWVYRALCGVSCAPNRRGPSYVFRNLFVLTGEERGITGSGFKMGGDRHPEPGLSLLLHNTVYAEGHGLSSGHYGSGPTPITTRNNVFFDPVGGHGGIRHRHADGADFDYDLIPTGGIVTPAPEHEAHAVKGEPKFTDAASGDYRLAANSPGVDAAQAIPGLNDDFEGKGPDTGAFERRGRDDSGGLFPERRSGISALPMLLDLRHVPGRAACSGEVRLIVPPSSGGRWVAHPSSTWLRCEPSSGPAREKVQTVKVVLAKGDHAVRLHRGAVTFRTDQGLNRTVMIDVKVHPRDPVAIGFEAEAGEITGGFTKVRDGDAAGGAYLHTTPGSGEGAVSFTFTVPRGGTYFVAARCMVPGPPEEMGRQDSFRFAIDGGEEHIWDLGVGRWGWDLVKSRKVVGPFPLELQKGRHRLTIRSREVKARLDRVVITNSPYAEEPRQR